MTDSYEDFKRGILLLSGIDLNLYRESQMKRRIDSFILRKQHNSYTEFLLEMKQNTILLHSFISYLTINVSEFYRNSEQWTILEKKVIPLLKKNMSKKLNIWSAACSTGEEPYTISMCMSRFFLPSQYKIIATDIDTDALELAKKGLYNEKSLSKVPEEYKARFFRALMNDTYEVKNSLKAQVEFKKHNLLSQFYPKDLDLICCRNVTIYFTPEAKKDVYKKFAASLKKDGILFIGSTEQISHCSEYGLESVDTFFYRKIN